MRLLARARIVTMATLYNERKAAQAAAFLLHAAGGKLPSLKLVKLLYLAERHSLKHFGEPLTGDRLVSMPHGPVLSLTYDQIKGATVSSEGGWDTWIAAKEDHDVALRDPSMIREPATDLAALSESDIESLESVWREYGRMGKWEIRDFTHDHCAEWTDPDGSSLPIKYEDVFRALGFEETQVRLAVDRIASQIALQSAMR